jgi:peptidoglycan/xylan/chitin deacetylase (PgdA/CDA1 family)
MKLIHAGAIATTMAIFIGILMVSPIFTKNLSNSEQATVLLSFDVMDDDNASKWCKNLSDSLNKHGIKAVVFIPGKVAEKYPECVKIFPSNIDVGSQTYSYIDLTSISDYSIQLEEVRQGKQAVDKAGNLYSRLFKAPYGHTDDNIYSLLTRADIIADFSYENQYNVYEDGQFIKLDLVTYEGSEFSPDFFLDPDTTEKPILIHFDSTTPLNQIDDLISKLKTVHIQFINPSELTELELTIRGAT